MRRWSVFLFVSLCAALSFRSTPVRADGGALMAGAAIQVVGGVMVGTHYGYGPRYYPPFSYYHRPAYGVPTYNYSPPYYVASPCWARRLPVYDRFGEVVAVRYEHSCR